MQDKIIVGNLTRDQRDQLMVALTLAYTGPPTGRIVVLTEGVAVLDAPESHWEFPVEVMEQAAKLGPNRSRWIAGGEDG